MLMEMTERDDHPAILVLRGDSIESHSYRGIAESSRRLGRGLVKAGIRPGDAVGIWAPNLPEWIILRFGIGLARGLAVAIDDLATEAEARTILSDSDCRLLFTTEEHLPTVRSFFAEGEGPDVFLLSDDKSYGKDWRELLAETDVELPPTDINSPAMLVYTSGTTGNPKSFALTEKHLAVNVEALTAEGLVTTSDRAVLPLPLHHVYPFVIGILTPFSCGATVIFPETVSGPDLVRAIRLGRASILVGVPRLYAAIVSALESRVADRGRPAAVLFHLLLRLSIWGRRRLGLRLGRLFFRGVHARLGSNLHLLASGGARFEASLVWKLEGLGWEVLSGYGLAETGSIFTANLRGRQRLGSEGLPLPGGELRIVDSDEDGVGEIQLKGPNVFAGYRNNPEANQTAFTEDKWFRTGDLGYRDEDGYLYVTGRAKEMIVLGGARNVFPEEVEQVYGESPYIVEIAVLERAGKLVALVRPDLDAIQKSISARVEDVLRITLSELSQRLPSFQRIAGYAIVREALPRTRLGKYKRYQLPEIYENALAGRRAVGPARLTDEDEAFLANSPVKEVWEWLHRRFPGKEIALETSPQLDLEIDSLDWVNLSLELESRFTIKLAETDLAGVQSIREFLELTRRAGPAPAHPPGEALAAELTPDQAAWLAPTGMVATFLGICLYGLNRLLVRLFFRLKVEGLENLPKEGAYVVAANHASDLDPLVIAAAFPLRAMRRIYWGGEVSRLFTSGLKARLARAIHIFPVDERAPGTVLVMASNVLAAGNALVWFPESWRSPTGELQRFLPGIGRLLEQSAVPVLPAYIQGTFKAMPRDRRLPRPYPVRVVLGKPLDPAGLLEAGEGDTAYARIASALKEKVVELRPETG